jgi:hypothetical protein
VRVSLGAAAALVLAIAGCEDIRRFEGVWVGPVSADPAHQQGFTSGAFLRATVGSVSRTQIQLTVDVPQQPGPLTFEPIRHAADDVLGELRLEGDPLRTFLGFLRPADGVPYLTVVSLFAEDRIDVRIIRADPRVVGGPEDTYGVFSLRRSHEAR